MLHSGQAASCQVAQAVYVRSWIIGFPVQEQRRTALRVTEEVMDTATLRTQRIQCVIERSDIDHAFADRW
jgi:hypothetical protein